jgi:stress response protein YsnF
LADVTNRANGDEVTVSFRARGKTFTFTEKVEEGRVHIDRKLPQSQRRARTGIVELEYEGNDRVRPTDVRLRAASGKAKLKRSTLSVTNDRLNVSGTISERARGVVRVAMSYVRPDGTVGEVKAKATIKDGKWKLSEQLPAEAANGGYVVIQFTGYQKANMRGEQTAKQVGPG